MRQVTGSKTLSVDNSVSIQLLLDGHSFCVDTFAKELAKSAERTPIDEPITIELITASTLLVPIELQSDQIVEQLLEANGTPLNRGQKGVFGCAIDDSVALMAIDASIEEWICSNSERDIRYISPLQRGVACQTPYVWLKRYDGVLYIKIFDNELLMAEVLNVSSDDEILYLIMRLRESFTFKGFTLFIDDKGLQIKEFKSIFKRVVCE